MAIEKRDPASRAKLFIPTQAERSVIARQKRLNKSIEEVEALKDELKTLIADVKKNK